MASCNIPEALQFGRLLDICAQHGVLDHAALAVLYDLLVHPCNANLA